MEGVQQMCCIGINVRVVGVCPETCTQERSWKPLSTPGALGKSPLSPPPSSSPSRIVVGTHLVVLLVTPPSLSKKKKKNVPAARRSRCCARRRRGHCIEFYFSHLSFLTPFLLTLKRFPLFLLAFFFFFPPSLPLLTSVTLHRESDCSIYICVYRFLWLLNTEQNKTKSVSMQRQPADTEVTAAAYTFRHPPQGFQYPKFRDPSNAKGSSFNQSNTGNSQRYGNVMHDRRVYRGNTYASPVMSTAARAEMEKQEMIDTQRRKQASQRAASIKRRKQLEAARRHMATPDPGEGRHNLQVQTEEYLEELTDRVEHVVQETQTDPLMDRPATPKFIPTKSGRDAETQIQEGELFRFDEAVEPILEVLVGKTLEQAMLEVMQEEELELLRQQQIEFEQRRKEELLEAQKLEAAERRKFEEKERRKKQEMERIQRERETREKLQARQFAKAYMANMENRVYSRLQDEGWFADRVLNEVELDFFPWLMGEVDKELEKKRKARALVDDLIREVVRLNAIQLAESRAAQHSESG
jgi:radial spoke head protein 3